MSRRILLCVWLAFALSLAGCRRARSRGGPSHSSGAHHGARLVVSVVLDQVGAEVLEEHLALLHEDGALKTLIARGMWHHRVVYPYAGTYTAPGHAAIYTGRVPGDHGVVANRVWSPRIRKPISVVDDDTFAVFGHEDTHASPALLEVETVADALKRETNGSARVVSVSMKDRGAVIPGGRHPDIAIWYDEDAKGFTTSKWYADTMPAWLAQWSAQNPTQSRFTVWMPLDPLTMPDDARGEGDWKGLGTTFPHDIAKAKEPYTVLLATPQGSELLLELAARAATEYRLGEDDVPDLLAISISGTDYVGHVFGPHSREAADNLVRVDLLLGKLLRSLEARTSVAVIVTADHGVSKLPEESGANAVRIDWDDVVGETEKALDATFGEGHWVEAFVQPYLVLAPDARVSARRDTAVRVAAETLAKMPGVAAAYDTRVAAGWREDPDPIRRAVALSIEPLRAGDVYLVPADGSVVDEKMPAKHGTSHGSPYAHDTTVPVILAGPGVQHGESTDAMDQRRVAATIAALLGVRNPRGLATEPLAGTDRSP